MASETTLEDLKNVKLLELYEKHFKENVAFFDNAEDADWFVKKIGAVIYRNRVELIGVLGADGYKRYEKLIKLNKLISLPLRSHEDIVNLFKENFVYVYELPENIDIMDKVFAKLQSILIFEERDKLKAALRKALLDNTQRITEIDLEVGSKKYKGTVGNWLQDYNRTLGTGRVDKLKSEEYLINGINIKLLNINDRKKIGYLVKIYERLKLSSFEPAGLEDPVITTVNGKLAILRQGHFDFIDPRIIDALKKMKEKGLIDDIPETLVPRKKSSIGVDQKMPVTKKDVLSPVSQNEELIKEKPQAISSQARLQSAFSGFLVNPMVVRAFTQGESINKDTKGDVGNLKNVFYHAINEGQIEAVLGALFILAENRQIREVFERDDRFKKFWSEYLKKQGLNAEEFIKDVAAVKYVAMFLQYILEKRLNMTKEDAVLVGVSMANLARKAGEMEYESLAYGDLETGRFKWNY